MSFEYALLANDDMINKVVDLPDFPKLNVKLMGYKNNLCSSNYSDTVCIWEGDLSVTLLINKKLVTINSHDSDNNHANKVDKYIFTGLRSEVVNKSRDETYLIFKVCVY